MVLERFTIGQMRSVVVFKSNTPTTNATTNREAVTTGGQNDVYSDLITTRGRLRKKRGDRNLDFGLINSNDSYELICRFGTTLNAGIKSNGKVSVDGVLFTIQSWEVVDQIKHWYKFQIIEQSGS
jgi:hypothetical protein